jgi:hypothetical protein
VPVGDYGFEMHTMNLRTARALTSCVVAAFSSAKEPNGEKWSFWLVLKAWLVLEGVRAGG